MAKKKQKPLEPEEGPEGFEFDDFEDKKGEEPEVEEFMEIGGSPVPGITLRHVLRGHTDEINRIAWSPDGRYLASPSTDTTIRIWDVEHGKCIKTLKEPKNAMVTDVVWSPIGGKLASVSSNLAIWDIYSWKLIREVPMYDGGCFTVDWSQNSEYIAVGGSDQNIRIELNEANPVVSGAS